MLYIRKINCPLADWRVFARKPESMHRCDETKPFMGQALAEDSCDKVLRLQTPQEDPFFDPRAPSTGHGASGSKEQPPSLRPMGCFNLSYCFLQGALFFTHWGLGRFWALNVWSCYCQFLPKKQLKTFMQVRLEELFSICGANLTTCGERASLPIVLCISPGSH